MAVRHGKNVYRLVSVISMLEVLNASRANNNHHYQHRRLRRRRLNRRHRHKHSTLLYGRH